ncbi:MAG: anhydro-N-acetylmuramic acid kinase [Xanthobacteraceae bacterium]|nr:anhydro-N-acetylmuramic acid kinase [Xanthobacteraceae bacterium]
MQAIGLMSGTSLDGVDVAALSTDGERITALGPRGYRPYAEAERALLREALVDARGLDDRAARPGALAAAEGLVTLAHGETVARFLAEHGIRPDIIGFHGQTVLHRPERRLTVQIGAGEGLARLTGIPVAYDFRAADVAAGGQGAPLVPVFHRALAAGLDRPRPLVVLNVGGVANVTWLGAEADDPIACDTGPGNALLDDFIRARSGAAFDEGGETAGRGNVDEAWLARALADPFFTKPPPKSLDRNAFAAHLEGLHELSLEDGAATLAAFTAASVARIVPHLPRPPASVIVAGGGARNRTLMRMLAERLAPASVETAEAVGWSADALEAQAFAFLAARHLRGLPITFPGTTGVARAMTGGVMARPG